MNAQFQVAHGGTFRLHSEAVALGRLGGELTVLDGRVWLTRGAELGDHFIEPGQRVRLGMAENAVIEPARAGQTVTVRWNPRRQSFFGAVRAEPLRGFAALARSAAASASRAQGCIAGGDSIASSGALK